MRALSKLLQRADATEDAPNRGFANRLSRDKRGNVLAITAASLPLMVGTMGLGVDFTQWILWKRTLQGGADSAALSGAQSRLAGASDSAVETEAVKVLGTNATVTRSFTDVNLLAGPHQGAGAIASDVEVIAEARGKLYFANLFMNSQPTIRVRARAGPRAFGEHCLMSLHPTANKALSVNGSAHVDLSCGAISNSNSSQAAYIQGTLEASHISTVGTIHVHGGGELEVPSSNQTNGAAAQADPFGPTGRNIQEPTCGATLPTFATSGNVVPGCYTISGGWSASGNLTMAKGVYVFRGPGHFRINSNVTVTGENISIVLTDGAYLDISGTPTIDISAMTTSEAESLYAAGDPRRALAGILLWQADASATANNLTGTANMTLNGAIYTPHSAFTMNGDLSIDSTCLQLIASTVDIGGDAEITNDCPNDPNWGAFGTMKVVLSE